MLSFKPLEIEDKTIIDKFIKPYRFSTCEFSFVNLFIWRKACNIEYAIYDDALIIKKNDYDGSLYFMQPLGYTESNLEEIIYELQKFKGNYESEWLFKYVETDFIKDLKRMFPNKFCIKEDRNSFDYIYESKRLISLSGSALGKKRNHFNHFIKNNNYCIKKYSPCLRDDCVYAALEWWKRCGEIPYLIYEIEAVDDILSNISQLEVQVLLAYVDKRPCAFSIGERLNENMAVIHIEKADVSIRGLYTFINKSFIESFYRDIPYINREEDMGVQGLRNVKMSYCPCRLEPKYLIKLSY